MRGLHSQLIFLRKVGDSQQTVWVNAIIYEDDPSIADGDITVYVFDESSWAALGERILCPADALAQRLSASSMRGFSLKGARPTYSAVTGRNRGAAQLDDDSVYRVVDIEVWRKASAAFASR